ncbi:hypothetical protein BH24ACT5_BH24ACT5_11500 [soil metagenome]
MQLANDLRALHALGADGMGVSVDTPERNAAMAQRWRLSFPIVSDPGGREVLAPLDLWSPEERGGIGWPAIVVFGGDGNEVARFRSRDFADRPANNDDVLAAVRSLGLPPLTDMPDWVPDVEAVDDPGAFRADAFGAYFRGVRFATRGLAGRLVDDGDRAEATAFSEMAVAFLDAWTIRRDTA